MEKKWTRESVENKLRELDFWHFLIEMEPGFFNVPRERWEGIWHNIVIQDYTTRTLLPLLDTINKSEKSKTSIIDIGCNEGWLALLLHRAGYKKIVGIDPNEGNIRRALFLKEYFNMENVNFHCVDISDFETAEQFDFSIILGVINHTHNPVGILKKIYDFTKEKLIIDFDSLCGDYVESSNEVKYATSLSDVEGNMKCHFERNNQMTSYKNNNLVFQYSLRSMLMMMNYAGFHDIFQILPKLSIPPQFKNNRRAFLVGEKHPNKKHYEYEIALDQEYAQSRKLFTFLLPELNQIPLKEINEWIDEYIIENKGFSRESVESDKFKYQIAYELILQSKYEIAKRVLEEMKQRHKESINELTVDILYLLGRVAKNLGNNLEAKKYWKKCNSIEPDFIKAKIMLRNLKDDKLHIRCNQIFF